MILACGCEIKDNVYIGYCDEHLKEDLKESGYSEEQIKEMI